MLWKAVLTALELGSTFDSYQAIEVKPPLLPLSIVWLCRVSDSLEHISNDKSVGVSQPSYQKGV